MSMQSLVQMIYEERMYEQARAQEREKEGASRFQISRLPERRIDLAFIQSHSNVDQDCVT